MPTPDKLTKAGAILCLAVLVAGSSCSTSGSRPCAGFGLPLAERWSTVDAVGGAATFRSPDGGEVSLVLTSIVDSEPYTGYDRFGAEEVVCNMTSERHYGFDDGTLALRFTFRQSEAFGETPEEQGLSIGIAPESPSGERLAYGYLMRVSEPLEWYGLDVREDASISRTTRAIANLELAGTRYPAAVEQTHTDPTYVTERSPDAASAITRVVLADGGGLVQFERADGTVLTRAD